MATPIVSNASGQFATSQFIVGVPGSGAPYTSVQDAVTAAAAFSPKGTVLIQPGTYNENITWPGGISVIGTDAGLTALNARSIIDGTQTFSANANISFENLLFTGTSSVWTIGPSAPGTAAIVQFSNCAIQAAAGSAMTIASSFATAATVLTNCAVTAVGGDTAFVGTNGTLSVTLSTLVSSSGNTVTLTDASALLFSNYSNYAAAVAAFNFTAAGTVNSTYDVINANGSNFVSGAAGNFIYSFETLTGSALTVAPGITLSPDDIFPPASPVFWHAIGASAAIVKNTGYIVTAGAVILTLPASANVGDTFAIILDGGTSWTIAQNAGQQLRVGTSLSTVGVSGSLVSSNSGDAVYFVCTLANTRWSLIAGQVGNLIIT